jgi:RHS repeat-associated protein
VDKLIGVIDANHVGAPEPRPMTAFAYYPSGKLKSETDPLGKRLLYAYTGDGRLERKLRDANGDGEIDPGDQLLLSYTYFADGKPQSKTDHVANETTGYSYDAKGRLQTASNPAVSYTFDYFDNGWLKSVTDTTHNRTIRYDAYDALGRRELVTLFPGTTDERVLDYVYDGQKRLEKIVTEVDAQHPGSEEFVFGYDDWSRRQSLSCPNGVVTTYGYNGQTDWLTSLTYKNSAGSDLANIAYAEHDKVGNRKQRTEDGTTTDYAYDDTYQLLQAKTGAAEENFTYDPVGNRESGPTVKDTAGVAYEHDDANRMTKGRKFSYEYDDFGNQRFRYLNAARTKFWGYTWSGENRMTEARLVKDGATIRTVTFKYDPFGRRIEKEVVEGATTTTYGYVYDEEDIVLENKAVQIGANPPATAATSYVHGPGIDEPLAMVRGGQAYYYHADGLGSVVAITDSQQSIVQRYKYESFGMLIASNPDFENSYTNTGREWDKETGLYFYRARYRDPMDGNFISKDPIGFKGGDVNLYRYVQNNSVNLTDPNGLIIVVDDAAAIAALTALTTATAAYLASPEGQKAISILTQKLIEMTTVPDDPEKHEGRCPPSDPCIVACTLAVKGTWTQKLWAIPVCALCILSGGL